MTDNLHSAPYTTTFWCDKCRYLKIHGIRDERIVNTVSYSCSCPGLQRPPQVLRPITPWEIEKCYYREVMNDKN